MFDDEITGAKLKQLRKRCGNKWRRPCVYIWFRKDICLYVGYSMRGIQRLYDTRHIIGMIHQTDLVKFVWFSKTLTPATIQVFERCYIMKLEPLFNS